MGSSTLRGLGRPEWIGRSENEYVAIAAALARDVGGRKSLRKTQRALMAAGPLCDRGGVAGDLEEAFVGMFDDWAGRN